MVPMIVVMPNGTIPVQNEVPPFAEDMVSSIIPFIEANYNVKADAASLRGPGLRPGQFQLSLQRLPLPRAFGLLPGCACYIIG